MPQHPFILIPIWERVMLSYTEAKVTTQKSNNWKKTILLINRKREIVNWRLSSVITQRVSNSVDTKGYSFRIASCNSIIIKFTWNSFVSKWNQQQRKMCTEKYSFEWERLPIFNANPYQEKNNTVRWLYNYRLNSSNEARTNKKVTSFIPNIMYFICGLFGSHEVFQ